MWGHLGCGYLQRDFLGKLRLRDRGLRGPGSRKPCLCGGSAENGSVGDSSARDGSAWAPFAEAWSVWRLPAGYGSVWTPSVPEHSAWRRFARSYVV